MLLPLFQNDYKVLIQETKGALWDLGIITQGRPAKVARIVNEFLEQVKRVNLDTCPAA